MFHFTLREILLTTVIVALITVIVRDRWVVSSTPVAFEGYCPVTLVQSKTWKKGDPQWEVLHSGLRYRFAGEQQRNAFVASPQRYAPMYQGDDIVRLTDEGRSSPGFRRHGLWYAQNIYLFDSEETLARFTAEPSRYVAEAKRQVLLKPAQDAEPIDE